MSVVSVGAETLKVSDVADELGVSVRTVHQLIKSGELQHERVPAYIRVSRDALDEYKARIAGDDSPAGPENLKVGDVASELGVSLRVAYELVASGELRSIRIRTAIRVPRDWLDQYKAKVRGEA